MDSYSPEAWRRLGRILERRRGELGYGFRQRARFARERGGGTISVKTISRLEKGERGSYPQSTIGSIETIYQWSPGSVESVLLGGDPDPLLAVRPRQDDSITSPDAPATAGERIASWIYVRMRQRGADEDMIHEFLEAEGLPREPTTISAVQHIAAATGAMVAEVLALLGVEDISTRRLPVVVQNEEDQGPGDRATSGPNGGGLARSPASAGR